MELKTETSKEKWIQQVSVVNPWLPCYGEWVVLSFCMPQFFSSCSFYCEAGLCDSFGRCVSAELVELGRWVRDEWCVAADHSRWARLLS